MVRAEILMAARLGGDTPGLQDVGGGSPMAAFALGTDGSSARGEDRGTGRAPRLKWPGARFSDRCGDPH